MDPMPQSDDSAPLGEVSALLELAGKLLFVNGQTTHNLVKRVEGLAHVLGFSASFFRTGGRS